MLLVLSVIALVWILACIGVLAVCVTAADGDRTEVVASPQLPGLAPLL